MTTYNFDREIERKKTNSLKYDFAVERGRDVDVLPLWVADMDFQAPKPVLDALQNAVSHGIFGYSEVKGEYFNALYRWFDSRFDWQPKSEWLVKNPRRGIRPCDGGTRSDKRGRQCTDSAAGLLPVL